MTPQELARLISSHPVLYHLTWPDSWKSIMEHGLLSTNSLLDRSAKSKDEKDAIGYCHRKECEPIEGKEAHSIPLKAVIRDQQTVDDEKLRDHLGKIGMSEEAWYHRQNERVFFFLTMEPPKKKKSGGLVALARKYLKQEMIMVCTKSLIDAYHREIDLSHYNTGFNLWDPDPLEKPDYPKRQDSLFHRIEDYPYKRNKKKNEVRELTVVGGVPDIRDHVIKIVEMNSGVEGDVVYPCGSRRSFF